MCCNLYVLKQRVKQKDKKNLGKFWRPQGPEKFKDCDLKAVFVAYLKFCTYLLKFNKEIFHLKKDQLYLQ